MLTKKSRNKSNKSVHADILRGVFLVVSLSLHCTTRKTPHKMRVTEALYENRNSSKMETRKMNQEELMKLREVNILTPKEGILREESLASWRLALNLAFNGFLISALFSTDVNHPSINFINTAVPAIGAIISFSFFVVSLMGAGAKHKYILENIKLQGEAYKPSWFQSMTYHILGPYVSSNILLFVFWVWHFFY